MMDRTKYTRMYCLPPERDLKWAEKDHIEKAPIWCSVDLRDGNQALPIPMAMEQKLKYFQLLTSIGFKQIEVGFPASSETEYHFVRTLVEEDLIPPDVTVQVLTQAREHIIRRTFEALEGVPRAIVHFYSALSPVHREVVFGGSKEEICKVTADAAGLIRQLAENCRSDISFEYSPEYFSAAEPSYVLDVCSAVLDVLEPDPEHKVIINLPGTMEMAMPHVFAQQVGFISSHLPRRDSVILSIHPHNDRGCAVADAEMGLLAGAQRVEGTLFGLGERAGNADLVTLALNLYAQGIDPELEFESMDLIREKVEKYTQDPVYVRSPYGGALVFAAFSGSHQDAIAKAMKHREETKEKLWKVPYLPIDPADIGRSSDAEVIRINSQSGKGGVGFILEHDFGLKLPKEMNEAFGTAAKAESDRDHQELTPDELYSFFKREFVNVSSPYAITELHFRQHNGIIAEVTTICEGRKTVVLATGNGRLNAVSNALKKFYPVQYDLVSFEEHALDRSSGSRAMAYVGILSRKTRELYWGAGIDVDIIRASVNALLTAVNHLAKAEVLDSNE